MKNDTPRPAPEPGSRPTAGAIEAAEVITGGKFGSPKRYDTTYGTKTVQGVAAVIDRLTVPRDLIARTEELISEAAKVRDDYPAHDLTEAIERAQTEAKQAKGKK